MTNKKNPMLIMILVAIITLSAYFMHQTRAVETFGLATASKVIVIDPGHGGFDPGKKGINGEDEKHINLKIALKLRDYLQQSGAIVIMTRTTDDDADGIEGRGHKKADMNKRRLISDTSEADVLISIHQNSFPQRNAKGAQLFYHKKSDGGKLLAEFIQKSIQENADKWNRRTPKSNSDYYVLRSTKAPAVIVECGFLTNPGEEYLLNTDRYQDVMAWSIYLGIVEYFESVEGQQ